MEHFNLVVLTLMIGVMVVWLIKVVMVINNRMQREEKLLI